MYISRTAYVATSEIYVSKILFQYINNINHDITNIIHDIWKSIHDIMKLISDTCMYISRILIAHVTYSEFWTE